MIARKLTVRGRVQGVGFRFAFADEARERALSGWVRNRRDGSVEALVVGQEEDVQALIAWARRGPPAARVSDVAVEPTTETAASFEIAPTA